MSKIIAIGPREQDFEYTNNLFSGSITLYGHNLDNNVSYCGNRKVRINHNVPTQDQSDFIVEEMNRKIEEDPTIRFMSYDPNLAYDCGDKIIKHTVCLNPKPLMDKLNHKILFRQWAAPFCNVFYSKLLLGSECTYQRLVEYFGVRDAFVIQADMSSGGEGTIVLTADKDESVTRMIRPEEHYLVSPYEKNNIPVNIHVIIYSQDVLVLPVSIQIVQIRGHKILYHGADFIAVDQIQPEALADFHSDVLGICQMLQAEGYRGVVGIDGMIIEKQAYILEINNRFQGSTPLLNMALHNAGFPSMQELNFEAFTVSRSSVYAPNLRVPYSCYTYMADEQGNCPLGHLRDFEGDSDVVSVRNDGLHYNWPIAPMASLERVVFSTNIVSVTSEGAVRIHPNIPDVDPIWAHEIIERKDPLHIKIALINQGIHISLHAKEYLSSHGGMREGVYNAVDLTIGNLIVNSAVRVKFSDLSPFSLEIRNKQLMLQYCGLNVAQVEVQPRDTLLDCSVSATAKVGDVCLLATDRVRVQHSKNCYFKRCGVGCRFCEVKDYEYSFTREDIFRAIDVYFNSQYEFRHFLIGGRSDTPTQEPEEILDIVKYIRAHGDWPVYVMCVPPQDLAVFEKWKAVGVTEIGMNIEIWDSAIAKEWMPGKGSISRQNYLEALKVAASLWGKTGAVRSAFVVGLESMTSLLEGIEKVCEVGAAPILSVFRPIPGTAGDKIVPPNNDWLLSLYQKAVAICRKYNLTLGPTCIPCQNNTLSMPKYYKSFNFEANI